MADIKLMQLKTLTTPNLQRTESPVEISMKRGRVSQDLKNEKKKGNSSLSTVTLTGQTLMLLTHPDTGSGIKCEVVCQIKVDKKRAMTFYHEGGHKMVV